MNSNLGYRELYLDIAECTELNCSKTNVNKAESKKKELGPKTIEKLQLYTINVT